MKKTIVALAALVSAAAFAGPNDLLVTFSTPGPDKYADGKTVLDGESYALVWTGADGTQKTVVAYPGAKDGKCPPVLFVIDENNVPKYEGGTWGVYLLDTRDFDADPNGATLATIDPANIDAAVAVKAKIADGIANVGTMASITASGAVSADGYDIPKPVVTAIKIDGANVFVTVKDVVPCLEYTLQAGDSMQTFAIPEGVEKDASSTAKVITLSVPKKDGAQFFKVTTK